MNVIYRHTVHNATVTDVIRVHHEYKYKRFKDILASASDYESKTPRPTSFAEKTTKNLDVNTSRSTNQMMKMTTYKTSTPDISLSTCLTAVFVSFRTSVNVLVLSGLCKRLSVKIWQHMLTH